MPRYRITADNLKTPILLHAKTEDEAWTKAVNGYERLVGKILYNGKVEQILEESELTARIAALEAEKAKLIEALIKAESALTYANWDGEFDISYTAKDVINARDTARAVLAEVIGHAK